MSSRNLISALEAALKTTIINHTHLSVGFGLTGLTIETQDRRKAAVKAATNAQSSTLSTEGFMLQELKKHTTLPVPEVYYSSDTMLIMEWIETRGTINKALQRNAAEHLSQMHSLSFPFFGYNRDTLIGPLPQPNPKAQSWITFFTHHRLLQMTHLAHQEGALDTALRSKLEKFSEKLDTLLYEPKHPSLLHGDLWTGNIIAGHNEIAGFIDPAIYCGHPEIELAFTTLFGTFDKAFFEAYESLSPLEPRFHQDRLEIYNLYPLLVHVRLFGASYIPQILKVLNRHGL